MSPYTDPLVAVHEEWTPKLHALVSRLNAGLSAASPAFKKRSPLSLLKVEAPIIAIVVVLQALLFRWLQSRNGGMALEEYSPWIFTGGMLFVGIVLVLRSGSSANKASKYDDGDLGWRIRWRI
jgi:hypothetical protein